MYRYTNYSNKNNNHKLLLLLFYFSCIFQYVQSSQPFYKTILYGEKLKGFLTISPADNNGDQYIVSFDIREKPENCTLIWAVHMSSAPYDMAVMTDNCRRVKKSPPVVKNMPVIDSTISGDGLAGNTLVISGDNSEVLACATVIIPGVELKHASFHKEPFEGHIHIIPIKNNAVRLVPDLKYMKKFDYIEPEKKIMTWAFVDNCQEDAKQYTDYGEVGMDSRATFTFDLPQDANFTLKYIALYREDKMYTCAKISNVEPRILKSLGVTLRQNHYFEPVSGINKCPEELHIRDDCLDISTETVHKTYHSYYPSVNIFGMETIMLKSLVFNGECKALRPQFAQSSAIATFIHPMVGRISLVDTDDKILLTGELRNIFEDMSTRATILITNQTLNASTCSVDFKNSKSFENAAIIVGKNEPTVTMGGSFEWFNISEMQAAVVDLDYMRVCENLTILPTGALSIHALIKRHINKESQIMASVVALEYPANNYTEILIHKKHTFSNVSAHFRPVDRSITNGDACSVENLGAIQNVHWIREVRDKLINSDNDSSIIFDEKFVTGDTSMLGTSLMLKDNENKVYCGHFEPISERILAIAELEKPFEGYIKLTQYETSNWETGYPTSVYYSIHNSNSTKKETVIWEIVDTGNSTCADATLFNPLQAQESECSRDRFELCPIGSASNRSKDLLMNSRRHLTAQNLPLSGPNKVTKNMIRLRSSNDSSKIGCYPLNSVSKASFQWIAPSQLGLSGVQAEFSAKTNVSLFKIEIDTTREKYLKSCTIYRLTILEQDDKLEKILNLFDVEAKKFKNDTSFNCEKGEVRTTRLQTTTVVPTTTQKINTTTTKAIITSSSRLFFQWFLIFAVVILSIFGC
ncbi:unnamed protein product [Caenorhabditis angaria]|uniref:Uncharacterized protein n=1 Tax=Caenorhabditis angaria TaxID=860376 RepID=A0A9P1NC31_9PELO|nr:unnamed protein product [Caenorhabditis angaria]